MKELLVFVPPLLHDDFIERYNELHKKDFKTPIELKELVVNETAKVFGIEPEQIIGTRKRSSDQISLACLCATYYLSKLKINNTFIANQLNVDPSLITYRLKVYPDNVETNKTFRVNAHQVAFNLSTAYPQISWE
jgi:hypothetical protein